VIHLMRIAELIEATGVAAAGDDLFMFTLPADVQNGIMIRGPLTGDPINPEQPDFYSSEFLVVVRGGDGRAAFEKCKTISSALTIGREQSGEIWITDCRPRTRPIAYPRSDAGTVEWGIPFIISWGQKPD